MTVLQHSWWALEMNSTAPKVQLIVVTEMKEFLINSSPGQGPGGSPQEGPGGSPQEGRGRGHFPGTANSWPLSFGNNPSSGPVSGPGPP